MLNNVSVTSVEVVVEIVFEPRGTHQHKSLVERFPYCTIKQLATLLKSSGFAVVSDNPEKVTSFDFVCFLAHIISV